MKRKSVNRLKRKSLMGMPSGVEGLDNLFFIREKVKGKVIKKPLGGYPYLSVLNIKGVKDTGKSLLVQQFAVKQASMGYGVCFVTPTITGKKLIQELKKKALVMGVSPTQIKKYVFVINCISDGSSKSIKRIVDMMYQEIKTHFTTSVIIDSVTELCDGKRVRNITKKIYSFMKKWRQTCLLVSETTHSNIGDIVDGSIALSKKLIRSEYESSVFNSPVGSFVRVLKIEKCNVADYEDKPFLFKITNTRLIKIIKPLEKTYMEK